MNITIVPGTTAKFYAAVKTPADAAQSLTQLAAAWFTVKTDLSLPDSQSTVQVQINSGITIFDVAKGVLEIVLTPTQTAKFQEGIIYYWDVRLRFNDNAVSNPKGLSGEVLVESSVTKSN